MTFPPEGENAAIPLRQNLEPNLALRRAIAQSYFLAKANLAGQIITTVVVPTAVALLSIALPQLRPFMVVIAFMAVLIDIFYLDRRQKRLLKTAAQCAERFDCDVLNLHDNKTATGPLVKEAVILESSRNYRERMKDDSKLVDWYPVKTALAPAHQARLICQLTNAQYDGRLRALYRLTVGCLGLVCIAALLITSIAAKLTVGQLALVVLTPSVPVLLWAGREFVRQTETDGPLKEIQDRALELWVETLSSEQDADYFRVESRRLQDSIYGYRIRSPLPVPFIYGLLRNRLETKMNVSAADRLRDAGIDPERVN